VHLDVDVLDPAVMPAVDAPDDGGIAYAELELLISGFVGTPDCLGMQLTVFDPDYDPDGGYAKELVGSLATGLAPLVRSAEPARGGPVVLATQRGEAPALVEPPVEITRVPAPGRRRSGGRAPRGSADRTG
jgi:arginase